MPCEHTSYKGLAPFSLPLALRKHTMSPRSTDPGEGIKLRFCPASCYGVSWESHVLHGDTTTPSYLSSSNLSRNMLLGAYWMVTHWQIKIRFPRRRFTPLRATYVPCSFSQQEKSTISERENLPGRVLWSFLGEMKIFSKEDPVPSGMSPPSPSPQSPHYILHFLSLHPFLSMSSSPSIQPAASCLD